MSFTRFVLSKISLPVVPCELPLVFMDYCPYHEVRLGYFKSASALEMVDTQELREEIVIAQIEFSCLSSFSFGEDDDTVTFTFDYSSIVEKILEEASKYDLTHQKLPQNHCNKCCIYIFFVNRDVGKQFRTRFMKDMLNAFDSMREPSASLEVTDYFGSLQPSTSSVYPVAKADELESRHIAVASSQEKQLSRVSSGLMNHSSQSDICGSEQESEITSLRSMLENQREASENYRATDSEVPSSPEKDFRMSLTRSSSAKNFKAGSYPPIRLMSTKLYVPPRLCHYLDGDLLVPFAKLQTLGSHGLFASIRTYLFQRGENGGLSCMDIARELSNPGYWREVAQLWKTYEDGKQPNFDFAFERLVSFLEWTLQTLDFVSDYGKLSAEELMLCRNTRWHETAAARKKFDQQMRQYFVNDEELLAVRNWCGLLREKTVFEAAYARASYLKVLDLGTMVTEGSFGSWNLKELLKRLENITDFTWLNCSFDGDECALLELKSVQKLKRLVLHVTKCDLKKFNQFFERFGFAVDDEEYEIVEAGAQYDDANDYDDIGYDSDDSFIDDRDEEELVNEEDDGSGRSVSIEVNGVDSKDAASDVSDVQLDYAALSFAFSLYRTKQFTKRRMENLDIFAKMFEVPKVVLMAKSIALNVPSVCLRRVLDRVGSRQLDMFSVGLPHDLCCNIRPNRTPCKDVVEILDNMANAVNRNWEHREVRFHVMVDSYITERVLHLFNLVVRAFPIAEKVYLRFEKPRNRDKDFYTMKRHMAERIVPSNICVFDLSIDTVIYKFPIELSVFECYSLEEFHLTLSGIRHDLANERLREDLNTMMSKLMNASLLPRLHTIVLRTNAPYLLEFCDMFISTTYLVNGNTQLRTLGFICTAAKNRNSIIRSKLHQVFIAAGSHLRRLLLDVRVLGSFSNEELADLRRAIPNCMLEAYLAPETCKDADFDKGEFEDERYRSPSSSPRLDEGFDRHLCSDYSDEVVVQGEEASCISTAFEDTNQALGKEEASFLDENSQVHSSQDQEIILSKKKEDEPQTSTSRVLRSGRAITTFSEAPVPSCSGSSKTKKRQSRKTRQVPSSASESDSPVPSDGIGRSKRQRKQRKVSSSPEGNDGSASEKEHSKKRMSLRSKENPRKRQPVEVECSNDLSGDSSTSNSDEWSPNKAKKTRRPRRSRRS